MKALHPLHLTAATLLRTSDEALGTALVFLVQDRTGQAAPAGVIVGAVMLPQIVAGPIVGDLLDRVRRPRAYTVGLALAYTVALGALIAGAGRGPMAAAIVAAVVAGLCAPISIALASVLPRIVPAARLPRAYGLEAASFNLAAIAGPALVSGVAVAAGPVAAGFVVVGMALLGSLGLTMLRLPPGDPAGGRVRPDWRAPVRGLVVLGQRRPLRAVTVATTIAFMAFGGVPVVAVLLAGHLGGDPTSGGWLVSAFALGALAGSLVAARRGAGAGGEARVLANLAAVGGCLVLAAVAPALPHAFACFALAGLFDGPMFAALLTVRQREAPPDRLGQVNTTAGSLKLGVGAAGAALTAALADPLGAAGLLLSMGVLQFAAAGAGRAVLGRTAVSSTGRAAD